MGIEHHVATSEQDYTAEENEVLKAIAKRSQERGRVFTSNIEILRFLKELGYSRPKAAPTDITQIPIVRQRQRKIMVPRPDATV